jgi:photosystem II stability/assembly factor-like uncharacterized protein
MAWQALMLSPKKRFMFSALLAVVLVGTSFLCVLHAAPKKNTPALRDDLFSVTFPTENDGWACGRWGTVIRTTDGGRTWQRQETKTDFTLTSISFTDVKNGWAVGDEGTIIHTSDGGNTWKKQKSPVPYFLMGVQFVTPKKGWIVTERTHILCTEDGGNTWNIRFKDGDFILKAVSFCDHLNGWAVGEYGMIYHTKDGGKTWAQEAGGLTVSDATGEIEAGNQLFGAFAVSPQVAWAVGIDGYATRTTDGGRTWTRVALPMAKTQLFGVAATGTGGTVIVGKRTFLYSPDSGKTWQAAKLDKPFTYGWLYGLSRRGTSGLIAVGQEGAIYTSKDNAPSHWLRSAF